MEHLNKMDILELKNLCKKYSVSTIGSKKDLIKRLEYFLEPIKDVLNDHKGRKLNLDKKIVGIKINYKNDLNIVLKNKGKFLYYSLGYHYYLVDKHLEL